MNKTALMILMSTSTFALSGCFSLIGMAVGAHQDSKQTKEAENQQFAELVAAWDKANVDELPTELEDLDKAYDKLSTLYSQVGYFMTTDEFNYKKVGTCADKRKASQHCKTAHELSGKVAHKMADVLNAGIDAKPVLGNAFPLWDIAQTQDHPELAAVVDVEPLLTRAAERLNTFWSKRLDKVGSIEALAHKDGAGVCFFSATADGEIDPRFAFGKGRDQLFLRCSATDPLVSYDRTGKDTVTVSIINNAGRNRADNLPGDADSASPAYTAELSMSALRKAVKASGDEADTKSERTGKAKTKPWRFVITDVGYITFKKVGTRAVDQGNGNVSFQDDIVETELARGVAIIDTQGNADDDEQQTAERDRDDDAADDDAAPKAKKPATKNTKAKKTKKAKKKSASRASRNRSRG